MSSFLAFSGTYSQSSLAVRFLRNELEEGLRAVSGHRETAGFLFTVLAGQKHQTRKDMNRYGDADGLHKEKKPAHPFDEPILVTFSVFIQAFIARPERLKNTV